jgi:formamidopyrimidine-DNA glycosylase
MPELPEVETVCQGLQAVVGNTIDYVELLDVGQGIKLGADVLNGFSILGVRRHGKYLIFKLQNKDGPLNMISHLRMTGQYIPVAKNKLKDKKHKHTRVVFHFKDYSALLFNDQRKFGTIELIGPPETKNYFSVRKLGPDALLGLPDFNGFLKLMNRKPKLAIKTALFDQRLLMGLGNIYAAELCFIGRVLPETPVALVHEEKMRLIHKGIVPLLKKAIKFNGTTFDGKYVNTNGESGAFSEFLKVYGQKVCKVCSSDILKIKLNGRGTYFCPKCQS